MEVSFLTSKQSKQLEPRLAERMAGFRAVRTLVWLAISSFPACASSQRVCRQPMTGARRPTRIPLAPDQPDIYVVSKTDARLEALQNTPARQFYIDGCVVQLGPGDTVLDVGANVGSFARMASLMVAGRSGTTEAPGPRGRVLAVEPLPQLCECLALNIKQHEEWAARRGQAAAPIVPLQCGLGSGASSSATFTFYPRCAALSTMHRNESDALHATLALVVNSGTGSQEARPPGAQDSGRDAGGEERLQTCATGFASSSDSGGSSNGTIAATSWLHWLAQGLARPPLAQLYRPLHFAAFRSLFLSGAQQVMCDMCTVSDIIERHGLSEVSLLKINVERAEEDVLMGVQPQHWPLIKQVSMQLHDLDGRLDRLEALMWRMGFDRVQRWQEPRFRGCSLWMLFASRRRAGVGSATRVPG